MLPFPENPEPEIFLCWLKCYFEIEKAVYIKELSFCTSEEQIRAIYKKYTGEGSMLKTLEKALAESYKKDRENKKNV